MANKEERTPMEFIPLKTVELGSGRRRGVRRSAEKRRGGNRRFVRSYSCSKCPIDSDQNLLNEMLKTTTHTCPSRSW
jgi:hypothetical protein